LRRSTRPRSQTQGAAARQAAAQTKQRRKPISTQPQTPPAPAAAAEDEKKHSQAGDENDLENVIQNAVLSQPAAEFEHNMRKWREKVLQGAPFKWKQEHWNHIISEFQSDPSLAEAEQKEIATGRLTNMLRLLETKAKQFWFPIGTSLLTICEQDVDGVGEPVLTARKEAFQKCFLILLSRTQDKNIFRQAYLALNDSTERDSLRNVLEGVMRPGNRSKDPCAFNDKVRITVQRVCALSCSQLLTPSRAALLSDGAGMGRIAKRS
jgi:hypothetical protein